MNPAIEKFADEWSLRLQAELPGATCSDVWSAKDRDGREVVLKAPHGHAEERLAIDTLLAFSRHGGVEILEFDRDSGAILMPLLNPGTTLADEPISDLEGADICIDLTRRLRTCPVTTAHFTLETYLAGDLDRAPGSPLHDFAKEVTGQLFATSPAPVLLHGDLHHFNILKHGDDWVVIDPKGLMGDPAYEPCAFMRNPVGKSIDKATLRARVIRFSEQLDYPIERVWGWSFVQTYACGISNEPGNMSEKWSTTSQALYELRTEFWNPDLLRVG